MLMEHIKRQPERVSDDMADPRRYRESHQDNNETLHALSRRGHWELLLFLLISTVAFSLRDFNLLASLPENLRQILGSPPPPELITIALAFYGISVLGRLLARMASDSEPSQSWSHLGYRTAFYIFYFVSNSLDANFMLVFVAGLTLNALEQFSIWTYTIKGMHKEDEILRTL